MTKTTETRICSSGEVCGGLPLPLTSEYFSLNGSRTKLIKKCKKCVNHAAKQRRQRKKQAAEQPGLPDDYVDRRLSNKNRDLRPPKVFTAWLSVCVRTGEVLTDRRKDVCEWFR